MYMPNRNIIKPVLTISSGRSNYKVIKSIMFGGDIFSKRIRAGIAVILLVMLMVLLNYWHMKDEELNNLRRNAVHVDVSYQRK